jgi:4-amino-4-deoxy-L-arabinose transferase-like glycosyltransferase
MLDPVKKLILAMASVFLLTIVVYLNSLSNRLLWDDAVFIGQNRFISDCSNLKTALNPVYLAKILPVAMGARPLVNITLLMDTCSGTGPKGMRVTNLIIHASNAVLLMTLAYALTGAVGPATLAGLIFSLHPVAAEPVAIITFRSQLLAVFFYLSALLMGLIHLRRKNLFFLAASALSALAAMLSNEVAITYPLVFALLYLTLERTGENRRRLAFYLSLCAAIAVAYFWFRLPRGGYDIAGVRTFNSQGLDILYPRALMPEIRKTAQFAIASPGAEIPKGWEGAKFDLLSVPPWSAVYTDWKLKIFTMSSIAAGYVADLLLPIRLKTDYNPPVINTFTRALPGFAALALACFAVLKLRRRLPLSAFGLLFTFAALLPVMNIIPIYNVKADRYLYLPLAGWALVAAALAAAATGKRTAKAAHLGLFAYMVFLGVLTVTRNPVFRDEFVFFTSASSGDRPAPRAQINMAAVYFSSRQEEKARECIKKAL